MITFFIMLRAGSREKKLAVESRSSGAKTNDELAHFFLDEVRSRA
jgi:hypothetical protein